jgi:hypothetical protein
MFRRTQHRVDESQFDRVYSGLAPPDLWLSQIAELIAIRGAPDQLIERSGAQFQTSNLIATTTNEVEDFSTMASLFDRVRVRGREELYLIVRIHPDGSSADLVQLTGKCEVEHGVCIATLERVSERPRSL